MESDVPILPPLSSSDSDISLLRGFGGGEGVFRFSIILCFDAEARAGETDPLAFLERDACCGDGERLFCGGLGGGDGLYRLRGGLADGDERLGLRGGLEEILLGCFLGGGGGGDRDEDEELLLPDKDAEERLLRLTGLLLLLCLGGGGIRRGGLLLRGDGLRRGLGRLLGL